MPRMQGNLGVSLKKPIMEIADLLKSPGIERVMHFESIDSTNTFAKNLSSFPETGMFIIVADRQTAGRGQRDRIFFSNANGGLYASIVCPIQDMSLHFLFNRSLSLAISHAIEVCIPQGMVRIKWPNDIYCSDKKVCGILLESALKSSRHLVMGFGINVNLSREQFPLDLRNIATSLLIESKSVIDPLSLLNRIVALFVEYSGFSPGQAHDLYCKRLYGLGRRIAVNERTGIYQGVEEDGRLRIFTDDGPVLISAGTMQFIDEAAR